MHQYDNGGPPQGAHPQPHGYQQAPQPYAQPGYEHHPQAQHGSAPVPANGAAPPSPKKRSGLAVALAVGGGVIVAGGVAAAVMLLGGGAETLPVDASNLPESTDDVSVVGLGDGIAGSLAMRVEDVPEEAYWSALSARACGGYDIFASLMEAAIDDPLDAVKALRRDPERYKQALSCGKTLAGEMGKEAGTYRVSFRKGKDERHSVTLLSLGVDDLPESVDELEDKSDPSSMENTRCALPWPDRKDDEKDDDASCGDHSRVVAKLEGSDVWAAGALADVKEFGSEYSPKGEHDEEELETMVALADELSGFAHRAYGRPPGFNSPGNSFLYVRAAAEEEEEKELHEIIEDDAVAWAMGSSGRYGYGEAKLIVVAENESKAGEIRDALEDFLSSLEEQVEKREKAEEKAEKEKKDEDEDEEENEKAETIEAAMKAKIAVARRALAEAELTVDGARVILTATEVPDEDETQAFEALYAQRKQQSVAVAKVVRGLLEGNEPQKDDLDAIDEGIQKMLDSKWPHEPEYAKLGFYVPGGYDTDRVELGDKYIEFKVYKGLPRTDLVELLNEINESKGWKVEEKPEGGYIAKKGSEELLVLIGEKDGSASLAL